jgi:hypothetical protein
MERFFDRHNMTHKEKMAQKKRVAADKERAALDAAEAEKKIERDKQAAYERRLAATKPDAKMSDFKAEWGEPDAREFIHDHYFLWYDNESAPFYFIFTRDGLLKSWYMDKETVAMRQRTKALNDAAEEQRLQQARHDRQLEAIRRNQEQIRADQAEAQRAQNMQAWSNALGQMNTQNQLNQVQRQQNYQNQQIQRQQNQNYNGPVRINQPGGY